MFTGIKSIISSARWRLFDCLDYFYPKLNKKKLYPPYSLRRHVGHIAEFEKIPQEYIAYFRLLCDLKMDETILDIGCGSGRFAIDLYGTPVFYRGQYYGFDVDKKSIDWATKNISAAYPNSHFEYVDLRNGHYNPGGRLKASSFSFPYEDQKFDFVFAMSVFTHLLPEDAENYLRQINRVLKPGGRALLTWLLLDSYPEELSETIQARKPKDKGPNKWTHKDIYSTRFPDRPEIILAYQESAVRDMLSRNNLNLDRIYYGAWSNPENYLAYQDILIVSKQK